VSQLLTSRVTVRGVEYTVQELTGKQMAGLRKLLEKDKTRMEAWLMTACCVDPKIENEAAAMELPQVVLDKVSAEIMRLSGSTQEDGEAKND
jgi:hypothetical protein